MFALLGFVVGILASRFKANGRLAAENVALRHQITVWRQVRRSSHLTNSIDSLLVQLYRWFPVILKAVVGVQPATLLRWHRAGFCCYWR